MPHRKISRPHLDLVDIIYQIANIVKMKEIQYSIGFGDEDDVGCAFGDIFQVNIKGYIDNQVIKRQFVIKWIAEPRKRTAFRHLYVRDFSFNNYIVPNVLEIQRQFKVIEGLKIRFPNCVLSCQEKNKELMVFARVLGPDAAFGDRLAKIDFDHCALVIKALAKLHGLCFALLNTNKYQSEQIKELYQDDMQYSGHTPPTNSIFDFYKTSVDVVTDPIAKSKLSSCTKYIFDILCKCVIPDRYSTICHGDCWNNNCLFYYKGNRPIDVILVDYQISRYASPVTDLSYFLYMCADEELLENHYDRLMDLYYKTLSAVLRQCDLDVNNLYPIEVFNQHLKIYSALGLIEALISLKIITAVSEEAIEMVKMRYDIAEDINCVAESKIETLFVKRVNGVVNDFFKRGYSLDGVLKK